MWGCNGRAGLPGSAEGPGVACQPHERPDAEISQAVLRSQVDRRQLWEGPQALAVVAVLGALCSIWEITSPSLCFLTC